MDTLYTQASAHEREEEAHWRREEESIIFGVLTIYVGISLGDIIYTKEVVGFSPSWFHRENLCVLLCCYTYLSFSDPIAYGYEEIVLIV